MIIDRLRSALFLSPAEDDDADEAVLLWAPLVPEPAADIDDPVPPVLNDGVRMLDCRSVDVTSAGAGVTDVGAIGTDTEEGGAGAASLGDVTGTADGAGGAGAASLDDVAGSGAPPPLASATLAYSATLSLGPGLTIITIPCVQWGDEKP
jgi:hypothetical protein